jgi:hypothetical protein
MSSRTEISAKATADEIQEAFREHVHSGVGRLDRFATKNNPYLALAETAMAERVKHAAGDLRATGKTMLAA